MVAIMHYTLFLQGGICEGWGYIAIIVIFSFLYNVTKFMEFETVTKIAEDGWILLGNFWKCLPCQILYCSSISKAFDKISNNPAE